MPTGVIIDALAVVLGGIVGGLVGYHFTDEFKNQLNLIMGLCSLGMGISAIGLMKYMPAVIFSVIIGTALGLVIHFGRAVNKAGGLMQKWISTVVPTDHLTISQDDFRDQLLTIIVLFCASGTGIYGSLEAGMTGDHSTLIAKAILDFFTAAIFACNLGYVVSVIALPQFIVFALLFYCSSFILPYTNADMINDFKACGGFIMLATGFRMLKLKMFPTADMILSMLVVMPFSWIWAHWILTMIAG